MQSVVAAVLLFAISMASANPPTIYLKTAVSDIGYGGLLRDDYGHENKWYGQAAYEKGKTYATLDDAWDKKENHGVVLIAAAEPKYTETLQIVKGEPKYETIQILKKEPVKTTTYVVAPEPPKAEYVAKTLGSIHKAPMPAGPSGAAKISSYHINTEPAAGLVSKNGGYY